MTSLRKRREEEQQLPTQTITLNLIIGKALYSGHKKDEEEERWRKITKCGKKPASPYINMCGGGGRRRAPTLYGSPYVSTSKEENWDPEKVVCYSCHVTNICGVLLINVTQNPRPWNWQDILSFPVCLYLYHFSENGTALWYKKEADPPSAYNNADKPHPWRILWRIWFVNPVRKMSIHYHFSSALPVTSMEALIIYINLWQS